MERKEFIKTASLAVLGLSCFPMNNIFSSLPKITSTGDALGYLARPSADLAQRMGKLLQWMKENGWISYLESVLGMKLPEKREEWLKPLNSTVLSRLQQKSEYKDFGGDSLLNPGFPQFSLIYHLLASPRVRPATVTAYPGIEDLDLLEDYIFSMTEFPADLADSKKYALAVLAYEYRPAYKIPVPLDMPEEHKIHADFVFSRAGIGRIGDQPYHYDPVMRSYTNRPAGDLHQKNIAVTPARYALFLVEIISLGDLHNPAISLLSYEKKDHNREFLRPIRKIIKNEDLNFIYGEYHRNEKLQRLATFKIEAKKGEDQVIVSPGDKLDKAPFLRISAQKETGEKLISDSSDMVSLELKGSSILLSSIPAPFVRPAFQESKRVTVKVPRVWKSVLYSNRRYASFKLIPPDSKDGTDLIITDGIFRKTRKTAKFGTARNAPLFANIKFMQKEGKEIHLDGDYKEFQDTIDNGRYEAGLFEDSICDGCIQAKLSDDAPLSFRKLTIMPAFSVVTAPDFFPLVDSDDIYEYYREMDYAMDEHFLEGGTSNLSWLRLRANKGIKDPFKMDEAAFPVDQRTGDSIFAVACLNANRKYGTNEYHINFKRDYKATTFLPDSASGIFYPGWDATFSSDEKDKDRFFATFGLGSPFPEDMKLCAAANGMWPVASPDAGRTFQGGLEPITGIGRKPSTSIPLMDEEIGYHKYSPYVQDFSHDPSFGWDGEQGPYIQRIATEGGKRFVNFTDIARADYVENCLNPKIGFDMSRLRELDSKEVISRMDALRHCVRRIDRKIIFKHVQYTKYWLVAAMPVSDWKTGFKADCIPKSFIGKDNNWIKGGRCLEKEGYLFIFALINNAEKSIDCFDENDSKRRIQEIKELCVCKIEKKNLCDPEIDNADQPYNLTWCSLKGDFDRIAGENIKWYNG
ncbi:hypothetical protein [Chryseobacterium sp. 22458]|uniref:hypothetical protein n=1 Tax=Chryseobacterium sp. 22458 TaxID=3453921 RepID=UPI003F838E80